ncbi:MAG: DUF2269 family protein [Alcaligenaceae bacterium]|nr:DUF2269 family protein [Alcaligenaceae bacterium]
MLYKHLKFLHLSGLCLFIASMIIYLLVDFVPGAEEAATVILNGRHLINIATWGLAAPALVLLFFSGLMMIMKTGAKFEGRRWLVFHLFLAALSMLLSAVALIPLGSEIYIVAQILPQDPGIIAEYFMLKKYEFILAVVILCLVIIAAYLAITKPRLKKQS